MEQSGSSFSIYEVFWVLWRRKLVILLCTIGVGIPVYISNKRATPVYEASVSLIFEKHRRGGLPGQEIVEFFLPQTYMANLIQEVTSRRMAEEVAESIDTVMARAAGLPVQKSLLANVVRGSIRVKTVRDSDVFIIICSANSAKASALLANSFAGVLVRRNAEVKREEARSVREFIESQLPVAEANLTRDELAVRNFKAGNRLVTISDEAGKVLSLVTSAESQYNSAATDRKTTEERLKYIQKKIEEQKGTIPSIAATTSPTAQELKKKLVDLEVQYSGLLVKGYKDNHPQMMELKRQMAEIKKNLSAEMMRIVRGESLLDPIPQMEELMKNVMTLEIEKHALETREGILKGMVNTYDKMLMGLPDKELELVRLLRSQKVNENLYSLLQERYVQTKIGEAGVVSDIRIIDSALEPKTFVRPRKLYNSFLGLLIGFLLGGGMAFLLEMSDTSLKSVTELERASGLSCLGLIPRIGGGILEKRGEEGMIKRISERLVTHFTPRSLVSEAYRVLRTNIQFVNVDAPLKSIVVTSAEPLEGKTTTVANLAITTAIAGLRTLLIDADMRRPMVHSIMGISREPGLVELISEKVDIEQAVHSTEVENLFVLTCGTIPPNPSEMLGSQKMKKLISSLLEKFSLVFFDSPPVNAVTDSQVLGAQADGVLLVVRSHRTPRAAIERAKSLLSNVRANVIGAVLNDEKADSFFGSYYNRYYYYAHDEKEKWWRRIFKYKS